MNFEFVFSWALWWSSHRIFRVRFACCWAFASHASPTALYCCNCSICWHSAVNACILCHWLWSGCDFWSRLCVAFDWQPLDHRYQVHLNLYMRFHWADRCRWSWLLAGHFSRQLSICLSTDYCCYFARSIDLTHNWR